MSVEDPLRAIAILERTLRGYTFAECSREFGVSQSRCAQLANLAVQFLSSLPFIRNATVPEHNFYDPRERLKHQRFWLKQIGKAKHHARVCVPGRRVGPAVERSIATALGRSYGLEAQQVISIATEFKAALLASVETPDRIGKRFKAQRSKTISTVHNRHR